MTDPLPYDETAERALLGAMLTNKTAVVVAQDFCVADDLFTDSHRRIFSAIVRLFGEGRDIDSVTVGGQLPDERDYLHVLADSCPAASNVGEYARIVHDRAQRRRLLRVGQEIAALAAEDDDVRKLVDRAEGKLYTIDPSRERQPEQAKDILVRLMDDISEAVPSQSIPTGFASVDELMGGMHPSNLVIIGARPGIGKTSFALAVAANAATLGRVLFFSLEMSRDELVERLACSRASVKLRHVREHSLESEELVRLTRAAGEIEKLDLKVDDEPGQTLLSLRAACRRERSKSEIALVVIDYLQLLTIGYRTESRFTEVSAMSRELKGLARTMGCPILALSQLNRESESHWSDGKPRLSHLRESGSIEQDADAVLLLSWPKDKQGWVNVDIAKNRHGPLGEVQLIWTPQYTRFASA
jgi:replicative DNA helicase